MPYYGGMGFMKTKKCLFGFLFVFMLALVGNSVFTLSNVSSVSMKNQGAVAFAEVESLAPVEVSDGEGAEGEDNEEETPSNPDVNYTIDLVVNGKGTVNFLPMEKDELLGTTIKVEILPEQGWSFSSIEGVELDEENSFKIKDGETLTVTANFTADEISIPDENTGVIVSSTADILPVGTTLGVELVNEEDQRFNRVKNLLSTPDKLVVYDINLKDAEGQNLEELGANVTLKIKLDEGFDAQKVKVFRVDVVTGEKVSYNFVVEEEYVVIQTDHFSLYTLSQTTGFKPASPSKDGTNGMTLTLVILGLSAVVAVIAVTVAMFVNRKKEK